MREIPTTYSTPTRGSLRLTVSPLFITSDLANTTNLTESYVRTIVNRYKSSPNIFAWELMNEARCLGDLPSGPACTPASGAEALSKWYKSQSDFVRSL